jgi:hypothetical protein
MPLKKLKLLLSILMLFFVFGWVFYQNTHFETNLRFDFRSEIDTSGDVIRIYYNDGSGFREENTVDQRGQRFKNFGLVNLVLPGRNYQSIRLDPGEQPGTYLFKNLWFEGKETKSVDAEDVLKMIANSNDIDSIEIVDGNALQVHATGNDPYLELGNEFESYLKEVNETTVLWDLLFGLGCYFLVLLLIFWRPSKAVVSGIVFCGILFFVYRSNPYVTTAWEFDFMSEIKTGNDTIELYYDTGIGFRPGHASVYSGSHSKEFSFVSLGLPAKDLRSVRMSLGNQPGVYYLRNLCLVGVRKKQLDAGELKAAAIPSSDIRSLEVLDSKTLKIEASGDNPYVDFVLNFPEIHDEISRVNRPLMLLLLLCLYPLILYLLFQIPKVLKPGLPILSRSLYAVVFIVSLAFVLSTYEWIELGFSNPLNISGPLTRVGYNPSTDVARFLYIIVTPLGVLSLVHLILRFFKVRKNTGDENSESNSMLLVGARFAFFALATVYVGNAPPSLFNAKFFDDFHEGESLAPAIDFMHGKIPYEETIFLHGPLQDPLKAVIGFNLFGKSISSMRIVDGFLHILARLLFVICLYHLFRKRLDLACIAFGILMIIHAMHFYHVTWRIPGRDIPLFLFLITTVGVHRIFKEKPTHFSIWEGILFFAWSFIPFAAFAYSVDRAYYLALVFVLLLSASTLFKCGLQKRHWICLGGGFVAAMLVLGFCIRFSYGEFFQFNFLEMPRFKDLMDGFEYKYKSLGLVVPVAVISALLFWLGHQFYTFQKYEKGTWDKCRQFFADYFIEITLCLICITFYKSALGRSDQSHIEYSTLMIYVTLVYIVLMRYGQGSMATVTGLGRKYVALLMVVLMLTAYFCYSIRFAYADLFRLPLGQSDSALIPAKHTTAISFLRNNLAEDDGFFTMTNESSWYYFLDKPCPSRFSTVWFAMPPFYQEEIVEDLKSGNVKYILYTNSNWSNTIDGYTNDQRLPVLTDYIKANYVPHKQFQDHQIWIKKPGNS